MFNSAQQLVDRWSFPSFLIFLGIWSALDPIRHWSEGCADHNGTHPPFRASLAVTGAATGIPLYLAHGTSTQRRSSVLKNSKGSKPGEASTIHRCLYPSVHQYLGTTATSCCVYSNKGGDPSPRNSAGAHTDTAKPQRKLRALLPQLSSCLNIISRATLFRMTYLLPIFPCLCYQVLFSLRYGDMQSTYKDVSYENQLICIAHFKPDSHAWMTCLLKPSHTTVLLQHSVHSEAGEIGFIPWKNVGDFCLFFVFLTYQNILKYNWRELH